MTRTVKVLLSLLGATVAAGALMFTLSGSVGHATPNLTPPAAPAPTEMKCKPGGTCCNQHCDGCCSGQCQSTDECKSGNRCQGG